MSNPIYFNKSLPIFEYPKSPPNIILRGYINISSFYGNVLYVLLYTIILLFYILTSYNLFEIRFKALLQAKANYLISMKSILNSAVNMREKEI